MHAHTHTHTHKKKHYPHSYSWLFMCLSREILERKDKAPQPSSVWYIMYSMAVLNPDNLPDLGQGNQFTKSPQTEKGRKVWRTEMGAGETWSRDGGREFVSVGRCGINTRF